MTVSINLATVCNSIASLSISGVTIKDIDEIPDSVDLLCPILIPRPDDFVTDIAPSFETFGSNAVQKMNLGYTLNYIFLHSPVGSGINAYANYSALLAKLVLIFVAIMSNDKISGLVDIQLSSISSIGAIQDPAGNQYWGVFLAFRVMEYVQ